MFQIEFYENKDGSSELWDFLESLRIKSTTNKTVRIEYNQISLYIDLLSKQGTRISQNITKHIQNVGIPLLRTRTTDNLKENIENKIKE